jgi:hypothetical protein
MLFEKKIPTTIFLLGLQAYNKDDLRALNTTRFGERIGGGGFFFVVVMHQKTPQLETMVILVLNRATARMVTIYGISNNPNVYNIIIK